MTRMRNLKNVKDAARTNMGNPIFRKEIRNIERNLCKIMR